MILEESSWKIKEEKSYPKLTEKIESDIVIIGAGIAGIFSAYLLARSGRKVVVLEKNKLILQNATLYTTAFITKVIDSSFKELVKIFGMAKAKDIWESGQEGVDFMAEVIKNEGIDCEFKFTSTYLYAQNKGELKDLESESEALRNGGMNIRFSKDGNGLNFKNFGYLEIEHQAMFHPIKFAQKLADIAVSLGVRIFADSKVDSIDGLTAITGEGSVSAEDLIIATNYPLTQEGTRFKKGMYRSYVYEINIPKGIIAEGMYIDMSNPYHYFRIDSFENFDRMIIGGEDHRKEFKLSPDKNFRALEKYVKNILGENPYTIVRKWAGDILESTDGLPLIGAISPHKFVISAFSGSGIMYAPLSAILIRDLIIKKENPYLEIYAPRRKESFKQFGTKALDYIGEFFGGAVKNFFSN